MYVLISWKLTVETRPPGHKTGPQTAQKTGPHIDLSDKPIKHCLIALQTTPTLDKVYIAEHVKLNVLPEYQSTEVKRQLLCIYPHFLCRNKEKVVLFVVLFCLKIFFSVCCEGF